MKTAGRRLLEREFPKVNFEDGKQERIVFAPPTTEAKKKADCDLQNLCAHEFEARVFEAFKKILLSEHKDPDKKNVTVLQVKV